MTWTISRGQKFWLYQKKNKNKKPLHGKLWLCRGKPCYHYIMPKCVYFHNHVRQINYYSCLKHAKSLVFSLVLKLWAFLDIDKNIQKIIKKTRIFDPFSIVKYKCLDQFASLKVLSFDILHPILFITEQYHFLRLVMWRRIHVTYI